MKVSSPRTWLPSRCLGSNERRLRSSECVGWERKGTCWRSRDDFRLQEEGVAQRLHSPQMRFSPSLLMAVFMLCLRVRRHRPRRRNPTYLQQSSGPGPLQENISFLQHSGLLSGLLQKVLWSREQAQHVHREKLGAGFLSEGFSSNQILDSPTAYS